jgi:SAM-dependent methyltransferase
MAKDLRNFIIYRIMDRALASRVKLYLKGRLIDIGCGTKPYQKMFEPYVTEHVGLDREQPFNSAARVDLVGTAYEIPSEGATFDSAVSTAALEHLAEPERALRECYRVLKSGGVAIYTAPLFWHVHAAPWDYYRFTEYGLKHLFEKAGFQVVEISALSGFWVTFGQMFVYYLYRFHRGVLRWTKIIPILGVLIQWVSYGLDHLDKAEDWTWMYLIVAKKP